MASRIDFLHFLSKVFMFTVSRYDEIFYFLRFQIFYTRNFDILVIKRCTFLNENFTF